MSHVKIITENVSADGRAVTPGEGRRHPVETDMAGARDWLEKFAALPAFEADEAEARLYLTAGPHHFVVRYAGKRLILEEGGTSSAASVDEIMGWLESRPTAPAVAENELAVEERPPVARSRNRGKIALLVTLVAALSVSGWWAAQPETPDGVEWLHGEEAQTILRMASGNFANEEEQLRIDAGTATLIASNLGGEETLRSSLRVGRRSGLPVLVTNGGVVLDPKEDGTLRIGEAAYRRLP